MRRGACLVLVALAACRPPATDDYVERVPLDRAQVQQRAPLASPDTEGAIWASSGPDRILYGKAGETPFLALACSGDAEPPALEVTRFAATDARAKALMAMVGNGHIARLKVDAGWNGKAWIWRGAYAADNPALDVLTGPRAVEVTIPGAGTLKLNASPLPRELLERCRRLAREQQRQQEPGEPSAPE